MTHKIDMPWQVQVVKVPLFGDPQADELVERVRTLRARILFDHGRRPAFRGPDGNYVDDQELDHGAWHFIASREPDGPPLGYIRLCTPATQRLFQSRHYLGERRYLALLAELGFPVEGTFEHSRLVVEHRARKLGLGVYLNALALGAARSLGAVAMTGTSGTKDGQDQFHERFGWVSVPGTRRYVPQYTEDVVLMSYRPSEGAGQYTNLVRDLAEQFPRLAAEGPTALAEASHAVRPLPARTDRPMPAGLRAEPTRDRASWRPTLFEPAREPDHRALRELLDSGLVGEVCDTIDDQLTELIRSREPGAQLDPRALAAKKADQLGGREPWEYGCWAWYPWTARLVHVLPREEFRLVRTDRNRGKIERPAQRRLMSHRIGVIGLSVGNSAAVTYALEGIGAAFKLADFDEFSLSNLNRLRSGVADLGVNKAVICARQMFEIDPYLDIEIYPQGLTDEVMNEFFTGAGGPIDLLVEECDTPYVKIAARERARELGIPVIMDCNDRGMLDVERFDLEPDRPLLHGLIGDIRSTDLHGLTQQERVDLILAMVDANRISPQLRASFGELGKTLSAWPQLASGVALGGALTAEAARRVLLGQPMPSGRYYVDLELLLTEEHDASRAALADLTAGAR